MFYFSTFLFVWFLANLFAWLEIQIEGQAGWAEKLPCWRPRPGSWIHRLQCVIYKPITGYHLAMVVVVTAFFHFPAILLVSVGKSWTWSLELQMLSLLILFFLFEDFFWFFWNREGLQRFIQKDVWWHAFWFGTVPIDYLVAIALSYGLAVGAWKLAGEEDLIFSWLGAFSLLIGFTLLGVFVKLWRGKKGG